MAVAAAFEAGADCARAVHGVGRHVRPVVGGTYRRHDDQLAAQGQDGGAASHYQDERVYVESDVRGHLADRRHTVPVRSAHRACDRGAVARAARPDARHMDVAGLGPGPAVHEDQLRAANDGAGLAHQARRRAHLPQRVPAHEPQVHGQGGDRAGGEHAGAAARLSIRDRARRRARIREKFPTAQPDRPQNISVPAAAGRPHKRYLVRRPPVHQVVRAHSQRQILGRPKAGQLQSQNDFASVGEPGCRRRRHQRAVRTKGSRSKV